MLRRVLRTPIGWLWMAASVCAIPLLEVLAPHGLFGHESDRGPLVYQVAFLSALAGGVFASDSLNANAWILRRSSLFQQLASQWVALALCALVGAGLVLLGSIWGAHHQHLGVETPLALVTSALHLAAIGGLLLQLPNNWKAKGILLPITAWVLPGLLASQGRAGSHLSSLLSANHDALEFRDPTPVAILGAWGPIMALGMLPILLGSRRDATLVTHR